MDISTKSLDQIRQIVEVWGYPPYRAKQIYDWVHKKLVTDPCHMKNLPKDLRAQLEDCFLDISLTILERKESSDHKSIKFLFKLPDGECVESVLMRMPYGNSVCVSTQVGCRMGCAFCASAMNGLKRNLTAGEILGQVYGISRQLRQEAEERVRNIVIMGIGEPLDNYDNVISFIKQAINPDGFNLSSRSITISTCGMSEKVIQLANEGLAVTLAISLHSGIQGARESLMPIARSETFSRLLPSIEYYFEKTGRRVTLEYALIDGVNDFAADAKAICALYDECLKKSWPHMNLIYLNEVEGKAYRPSREKSAKEFEKILLQHNINVTVRKSLGADIDGACGMLRARRKK